jgi:lipopolysaccharide biosynthesis regulator YciM
VAWSRQNAAALKPEDIPRAWKRALQAAVDEDWATTETWLERIVEADGTDLDAYHNLGRIYRHQGAVGRAIRMHQNLLLRTDLPKKNREAALFELACDLESGGFDDRAAAAYEEFLEIEPRHPEALRRAIPLLQKQRAHRRVLALAKRLRRHDAELADRLELDALLQEAAACSEEGNQSGARQALKRALKTDRNCAAAYALLGDLEAERGKDKAAIEAWKKAAAADPEIGASVYSKIEAGLSARAKTADFEKFLKTILSSRPTDAAARIALARALVRRAEPRVALEELARAIEKTPADLRLHAELGKQLLAGQQDAEALKAYGQLLDRLSMPPDAGGDVETEEHVL